MPSAWSSDVCSRSEEHTSELQSHDNLVCRLLLETKNISSRAAHAPVPRHAPRRHLPPPARSGGARGGRRRRRGQAEERLERVATKVFFLNKPAPPKISPLPPPDPLPI